MSNQFLVSSPKKRVTKNLHARVLTNELGRQELALIVNENTTLANIEKEWNSIKSETNKILQLQGTDPNDYFQLSRLRLAHLYLIEGFSYTEVAMDANYDTLCNLVQIVQYMNSGDISGVLDFVTAIRKMLGGLGMKSEDVHRWITESLNEVKNGVAPWSLTDGPVTKQRIVDLVRQLEREINKSVIVLKENPPGATTESIALNILVEANSKTMETADRLLNQLPKSGGLDKLDGAHQRYVDSLKG